MGRVDSGCRLAKVKIWVYSPQFLVYPFTQNSIVVTYVTLFIYWQKLNAHGSKTCFNAVISFHCDRDERRHCQSQCNVYGWNIKSVCQ